MPWLCCFKSDQISVAGHPSADAFFHGSARRCGHPPPPGMSQHLAALQGGSFPQGGKGQGSSQLPPGRGEPGSHWEKQGLWWAGSAPHPGQAPKRRWRVGRGGAGWGGASSCPWCCLPVGHASDKHSTCTQHLDCRRLGSVPLNSPEPLSYLFSHAFLSTSPRGNVLVLGAMREEAFPLLIILGISLRDALSKAMSMLPRYQCNLLHGLEAD